MRWRIPIVLSLALFAVASCDQVPTVVEDAVSDSPALRVVQNQWYEDTWSFPHCEEWVDALIRYKWLETHTESASGNTNYQWKFTVHGKGVGRDTGWEYVWNNSFDWAPHTHDSADGAPYSEKLVDNWVIIGKGKAPNFQAKVTYKFTINATGEVSVDFVHYHERCE